MYTMAPVFSLVLDRDVTDRMALVYPELYKELLKGRALSLKNFFVWVLISLYQGDRGCVLCARTGGCRARLTPCRRPRRGTHPTNGGHCRRDDHAADDSAV